MSQELRRHIAHHPRLRQIQVVVARYVRNRRLVDACDGWAFSALNTSPGARAFYDQHKAAGTKHHAALRTLANRLVGILHGCLEHQTPYDERVAWGHRKPGRSGRAEAAIAQRRAGRVAAGASCCRSYEERMRWYVLLDELQFIAIGLARHDIAA